MSSGKVASWAHGEEFVDEASLFPDAGVLARARDRGNELGVAPVLPGAGALMRVLAAAADARAAVEIGTGSGVGSLYLLAGMNRDGVLTTIDPEVENQRAAREAFAEAKIRTPRVRTIAVQPREVVRRLTDHAYDLVSFPAHDPHALDLLGHARRLLRPGGVLVISTPCSTTEAPIARTAMLPPAPWGSCCRPSPRPRSCSRRPRTAGTAWWRRSCGPEARRRPRTGWCGAVAAEPYAQALMTPSRASRRAAASAAAISTTRRPPPSSGTRMMMLRPSSTTSSGPSPVRGFIAAMACLLDGFVALLWHPRTGPRATRVRWPLSQVLRPTRTMTPPASRRKRYPLPRTAPGDLHEHHCDDCRDQQQKEHHRADRGHCRAASRSTSRASSAVSTTRIRSTSPMPITPDGCTDEVSQSSNPCQ